MVDRTGGDRNSMAAEVLSRLRISEVYHALARIQPRRTGKDTWRAPASWRNGDNPDAVSGDDSLNVCHDFVANEGGGIVWLVARIQGCSRAEAFRWCADFAGVPLSPMAPADRRQYAQEYRQLEQDLPDAMHWRRAAAVMTEELLVALKASFFDTTSDLKPHANELRDVTDQLARLERLAGFELAREYRWWREHYPGITAGMVRSAKAREQAAKRVLLAYLKISDQQGRAA